MFADVTNHFCCGNSSVELKVKHNKDLDDVNNSLVANQLTLNVKKP